VRLLVLGGTRFLGRHFVEAALARGHEVTLFTRGRTNPDLFPEAERLHGDRDGGLSVLEGRTWDAVVDTPGYFPRIVRASAELLRDAVEQYAFVSTVSVYADLSTPQTESSALATIEDETVEDFGPEFGNYGPLKALCEAAVQDVYGDGALIVRPGFIVGPYDPTDRFTYWAVRANERRAVLAPAPPDQPLQFIDVRDLADWMLRMIEESKGGIFNAANEAIPFHEVLDGAEVAWVSQEFLAEHGIGEEELPLLSSDPQYAALHDADVSAAVGAGLTFRPVDQTVNDTAEWRRGDEAALATGLSYEREATLIGAWRSSGQR
jgi:nucleoside-diphosphate-sugar epimerase